MRPIPSTLRAAGLLLAIATAGCAGTHSGTVSDIAAPQQTLPPRSLLVSVSESPGVASSAASTQIMAAFAAQLARKLQQDGTPVAVLPPGSAPVDAGQPAVLVRCELSDIRAGNQALRLAVGFGAGRAAIRIHTTLVDLRGDHPVAVADWDTESTTGRMPSPALGLIAPIAAGQTLGIVGGGAGVMLGARETMQRELDQSSTAIARQLATRFQDYGWQTLSPPATSVLQAPRMAAPTPAT